MVQRAQVARRVAGLGDVQQVGIGIQVEQHVEATLGGHRQRPTRLVEDRPDRAVPPGAKVRVGRRRHAFQGAVVESGHLQQIARQQRDRRREQLRQVAADIDRQGVVGEAAVVGELVRADVDRAADAPGALVVVRCRHQHQQDRHLRLVVVAADIARR